MFMKHVFPVLLAVPTALGLVGLAAYQRYIGPVGIPAIDYYLAAAVICLAPYAARLIGHAGRRA